MDEQQAEVHLRKAPDPWGDGGPGAEARWTSADADALGYAAAAAADTGVLVMLSRSQDGGALMVAFMDDGVTSRRWFHNAADAVAALEAIPGHLDAQRRPSPPPTAGRGGRGRGKASRSR